jgi:hypothetical protein
MVIIFIGTFPSTHISLTYGNSGYDLVHVGQYRSRLNEYLPFAFSSALIKSIAFAAQLKLAPLLKS